MSDHMEYQDDDRPSTLETMGLACPWCGSPLEHRPTDEDEEGYATPPIVCSKKNDPDCAYPWLDLDADFFGIHAAAKSIESGALPPGWRRFAEQWRRDMARAEAIIDAGRQLIDGAAKMVEGIGDALLGKGLSADGLLDSIYSKGSGGWLRGRRSR